VPKFKPGDIVICVQTEKRLTKLHVPCVYEVEKIMTQNGQELLKRKGFDGYFLESRFRLIKSA